MALDVPALHMLGDRVQEQVDVRVIPEVHAGMPFSVAHVQEQVIVREIPEVHAGPPVSSALASVQEQVIVCETPGVQVLGHVQEQGERPRNS